MSYKDYAWDLLMYKIRKMLIEYQEIEKHLTEREMAFINTLECKLRDATKEVLDNFNIQPIKGLYKELHKNIPKDYLESKFPQCELKQHELSTWLEYRRTVSEAKEIGEPLITSPAVTKKSKKSTKNDEFIVEEYDK